MAENDYMAQFQEWLGSPAGREWLAEPDQHSADLLAARDTLAPMAGFTAAMERLEHSLDALHRGQDTERSADQEWGY